MPAKYIFLLQFGFFPGCSLKKLVRVNKVQGDMLSCIIQYHWQCWLPTCTPVSVNLLTSSVELTLLEIELELDESKDSPCSYNHVG